MGPGNPPWLEGLEGEEVPQLIETDASKVRVIAGPGSGKTTGLKRRVRRLLEDEEVEPESIFVGTFTRAITQDLAEELEEYREAGVRVSTLHSHALSLLLGNQHVLGDRIVRFLLDFEQAAMLYDIKNRLNDSRTIYELEDEIHRLAAAYSERGEFEDAKFSGAVDRWLREHGGMLVHEVVPIATEALEGHDLPRGEFDHVVIDEYQDLTKCEQEMVELIWSGEGSLVVLGDDDQSIYGFRNNHPDGVGGFEERHTELTDIPIPDNRRSGSEIVRLANLMMQEAGPTKAPMDPKRPVDGDVSLIHWNSVEEEIEGLTQYIEENDEQDFLVLVPRRFIGYQLRDAIGEEARTEFRQAALDHELLEERFTLGTLLADPGDAVAARAWLGFHHDGSRATERNSPAYLSVFDPERSGRELIQKVANGELEPGGRGQKNVRERARQFIEEEEQAPEGLQERIDYLFNPEMAEAIDDEDARARVSRNLQLLRGASHEARESIDDPSLYDVLENLRYKIATRAPLSDREEDARVRIMTLHSAKGLEADVIVVAGAADQMIPGEVESIEEREEQRRLLYVAITRAREELIISWPQRITMRDAKANWVREDDGSIFRAEGKVQLGLSKTTLLPNGGPSPKPGEKWLSD